MEGTERVSAVKQRRWMQIRDKGRAIAGLALLPLVLSVVLLAACKPQEEPKAEPVRPVRVLTVDKRLSDEPISLTGQIKAEDEVNLAFRVGGRMIERSVNIGDRVTAGQVVARLEQEPARNALRTARANLESARGELVRAENEFNRQRRLLASGATARSQFDQAEQALRAARAQVDSMRAQLDTAQDQLDYTRLIADVAGSVTARGAEPGEVVEAGRMIVRVALQGGRDAVFDVPERLMRVIGLGTEVAVALATDPATRATGRVREVSPQADPVTRTFQIRVGLRTPPATMRLGSTVTGAIQLAATPGIDVPASALTQVNGQAAVWVVDPSSLTVSLRPIRVERYDLANVRVAEGLAANDIVVTAGVQALRPGQKVRLLEAAR